MAPSIGQRFLFQGLQAKSIAHHGRHVQGIFSIGHRAQQSKGSQDRGGRAVGGDDVTVNADGQAFRNSAGVSQLYLPAASFSLIDRGMSADEQSCPGYEQAARADPGDKFSLRVEIPQNAVDDLGLVRSEITVRGKTAGQSYRIIGGSIYLVKGYLCLDLSAKAGRYLTAAQACRCLSRSTR